MIRILIKLFLTYYLFINSILSNPEIQNVTSGDSLKIAELNELCWDFRSSNPQIALEYGEAALSLIEKTRIIRFKPVTLNYLGVVHRNIGDLRNALSYYREALKTSTSLNDSLQIAYSLNNIGDINRVTGNYSIAIEKTLNALAIFENLKNNNGIAYCFNNVGLIYLYQGLYEKAVEYLGQSIELRKKINDIKGQAKAMRDLAETYIEMQDYEKAFQIYQTIIPLNDEINYEKGKAAVFAGISTIYYKQNSYVQSLKYRKEALEIDRRINNKFGEIFNLNSIGQLYLEMANFASAREYLLEANRLAVESGFIHLQVDSFQKLSLLYSRTYKYKLAFEAQKKFEELKDTIFRIENFTRFSEVEAYYEAERQEKENLFLRLDVQEAERTRNFLIIISILVMCLVFLYYKRYTTKRKANIVLRDINRTKDKLFKILAHDMRNPLSTIVGYSDFLTQDFDTLSTDEKTRMLSQVNQASHGLYFLLENLLEWAESQLGGMKFNPEKFFLKELLEEILLLHTAQASAKKINLSLEQETDLECFADKNMLRSIIRNLVHNALKFTPEEGQVQIKAFSEAGNIVLSVMDNGVGIEPDKLNSIFKLVSDKSSRGTNDEKGSGLGLNLCKELVQKNGGKIWVTSIISKGTTFYFTVPSVSVSETIGSESHSKTIG